MTVLEVLFGVFAFIAAMTVLLLSPLSVIAGALVFHVLCTHGVINLDTEEDSSD